MNAVVCNACIISTTLIIHVARGRRRFLNDYKRAPSMSLISAQHVSFSVKHYCVVSWTVVCSNTICTTNNAHPGNTDRNCQEIILPPSRLPLFISWPACQLITLHFEHFSANAKKYSSRAEFCSLSKTLENLLKPSNVTNCV